jgi:16S rRNA (guanine1207-N2)-methyltransferase
MEGGCGEGGGIAVSESAVAEYHRWQAEESTVAGRRLVIWRKAGLPGAGPADVAGQLLAHYVVPEPTGTVLLFNTGATPLAAVVAERAAAGQVIAADGNLVAMEAARRLAEANGLPNLTVALSVGISHLTPAPVADVVAVRLPKGRLPTLQLIADAFEVLRPGGSLYLAGANNEGIQSALRWVGERFGNVTVLDYRKGQRIGRAIKPAAAPPIPPIFVHPLLDHARFHQYAVHLAGETYQVRSRPGVFSWEKPDAGSLHLLAALTIRAGEQVLDLGSGTGLLGVVAGVAAAPGAVTLVDVDVDAVDSSQETLAVNHPAHPRLQGLALASDATAAVRDHRFDVVLTNPPFHLAASTSLDVAQQFVADAAAVLRPGGRLYLVANRFLPYETALRMQYRRVTVLFADRQYKVLLGEK